MNIRAPEHPIKGRLPWVTFVILASLAGCGKDDLTGNREIKAQNFSFSVPRKYQIKEATAFQQQMEMYRDPEVKDMVGEIERATGKAFDPQTLKHHDAKGYQITMGKHELAISLRRDAEGQADLKSYVRETARENEKLEVREFMKADLLVQSYGDFSNDYTWMAWMIRKGDSTAQINFQGEGQPSSAVKGELHAIIDSFRFQGTSAAPSATPPH